MRTLGILALLFSLNCFAQDKDTVNFFNGARLVVVRLEGSARNLIYYPPKQDTGVTVFRGEGSLISILPAGTTKTPEEIIKEQFQGVAPKFWPVVTDNGLRTRSYISEDGKILTIAKQGSQGSRDKIALEIPDKWELHKVNHQGKQYLVIIEDLGVFPTTLRFLRLKDGYVAEHINIADKGVFFDELTEVLYEKNGEGVSTPYDLSKVEFKPRESGKANEMTWFPKLEEAKNLNLTVTADQVVQSPQEEKQPPIDLNQLPKVTKTEIDSALAQTQPGEFKKSVGEFATSMGGRNDFKPVPEFSFKDERYILVELEGEKALGVVDTRLGRVIQKVPLDNTNYTLDKSSNTNNFTIEYPGLGTKVLYHQPTMLVPEVIKISSKFTDRFIACDGKLNSLVGRAEAIVEPVKP